MISLGTIYTNREKIRLFPTIRTKYVAYVLIVGSFIGVCLHENVDWNNRPECFIILSDRNENIARPSEFKQRSATIIFDAISIE